MVILPQKVNWFQRLVQRFAWSPAGRWVGSNFLHYIDRFTLRITRGRTSLSSIIAGVPIVFLTTTGAKSGNPHTTPLIGFSDGQRIILVASSWGRKKHPGWYYNLIKNPKASLTTPEWRKDFVARLATDEESKAYWDKAIALFPGYAVYREIARHRRIGIFVLEPVI